MIQNSVIYQLQLQSDILTAATENNVLIKYSLAIQNAPVSQITGFQVAIRQKVFWFSNQSGADILLKNNSSDSFYGNRISLPESIDFTLTDGSTVMFFYNVSSTSWYLFIPPALSASDFDPAGSAASAQAYAIQRANQTGTQLASTISDFSTAVASAAISALITNYPEANLGVLTWDGTPPSGTITKVYRAYKIQNVLSIWFKIRASIAGSGVNNLTFPLPPALPTPDTFSSQLNNDVGISATGSWHDNINTNGTTYLALESGSWNVHFKQTFVTSTTSGFDGFVQYLVA